MLGLRPRPRRHGVRPRDRQPVRCLVGHTGADVGPGDVPAARQACGGQGVIIAAGADGWTTDQGFVAAGWSCCHSRPLDAVDAGARDLATDHGGRGRRRPRRREGGAERRKAGHHDRHDEGGQKAKAGWDAGWDGRQEAQGGVSWVRQAPFRVSWLMPMQAKAAGGHEVIHDGGGNESETAVAATVVPGR